MPRTQARHEAGTPTSANGSSLSSLHENFAAAAGARNARPQKRIAMQRHMPLQASIYRLAHQVVLRIARVSRE